MLGHLVDDVLELVPWCKDVQQGSKCALCGKPDGYPDFGVTYCEEPCPWALRILKLLNALSSE